LALSTRRSPSFRQSKLETIPMTKPKKSDAQTDTERLWDAATKAKEEATRARERATQAVAVVHVAHEALAVAQTKAADAKLTADRLEQEARDQAEKARRALEDELRLEPSQDPGQKGDQLGADAPPTEPDTSTPVPEQQAPEPANQ
jgi:hypothetical protein